MKFQLDRMQTVGFSQKRKINRNFQRGITLLIFGGLYLETICAAPHHGLTTNQLSA